MWHAISRLNMQMSKQAAADSVRTLTIQGKSGGGDIGALVCDIIMVVILLWNQIRYGMDMLFLIIPLILIGFGIVVFGIIPETYCFTETALEVTHKFHRTVRIPYETVFNFDAAAQDRFINILRSNTVKVYHTVGKKKKLTVCAPQDVEGFVDALKANCPEFHVQGQKKSRLAVFFEGRNDNDYKGDNEA